MSTDPDENGILGSLDNGAEFHLVKPLTYDDVRILWQFSVLRKIELNRLPSSSSSSENGMSSSAAESLDIFNSISLESDDDEESDANQSGSKRKQPENSSSRNSDDNSDSSIVKKNRIVWTDELHNKFVHAVDFLGAEEAFSKNILQHMNAPGLRKEDISSHLQFSSNPINMGGGGIYQFPGSQKGIAVTFHPEINNIFTEHNVSPANLEATTSVGQLFGAPATNFDVRHFSNMISGHAAAPLNYGYALESTGSDYDKNKIMIYDNNNNNSSTGSNLQPMKEKDMVIGETSYNNNNIGTISGGYYLDDQLIDESTDWRALLESVMGEELTPVPQPQPVEEQVAAQPAPAPQIAQPAAAEVTPQPSNFQYGADGYGGIDDLFNMLNVTSNFFDYDFSDIF
ncbi:two-component response regulator ARR14-like [Carica papaya]|uniref:two-component response regulator ARR14-like n=2 Tax=Carica papaya TaxID=3649 RepID=UPI000B8CE159|nr:two-component response regulator ARR14-like [Carica papaya]